MTAFTAADVERAARSLGGAQRTGADWMCRCPAHDDRKASLSLRTGDDGKLLWCCHAGCDQADVLDGLKRKGVLMNGDASGPRPGTADRRRIVATYDYVDEQGALLFQVVRYHPKDFRQRRPDGNGGWIWSLDNTRRVLFHLPEVLAADEAALVEGEKDSLGLKAAGFVATTNPGGAGEGKWLPAYTNTLAGKRVVIIGDNDAPGQAHARRVAGELIGKAATVKLLRLEGAKDASEWLAAGHTADELRELIGAAPEWQPSLEAEEKRGRAPEEQEPEAGFDLTHDGLALEMGQDWADNARHVALWGQWLDWNGSKWERDEKLRHMTRTRNFLRAKAEELKAWAERKKEAEELPEGKERNDALKEAERMVQWAERQEKTLRSAPMVANVVGLARSNAELAAGTTQWDADPWALNTPAGIVDLRTGKPRPSDPLAYCTKCTAVALAPPGTAAPKWQAFLERIFRHDPELIPFMQRVLGYGLTGLTTEHALIFAWGQGGNGKGVLLNSTSRILGDYAAIAPADLLLVTQSDRHPCDMAMLRAARFVTAQELAPGRAWDEPKLKSLTGGDPITARFIRQDFFTYEPQFLLVVAGNHKPSFKGVDEAIRRRVQLVPFLQNIPEKERDKELPEKLKAEWPAILRWLIDGCLAWQKEGLNSPASVREASEDYLNAEDVLGQWLAERCLISAKVEFTPVGQLYGDWKEWCGKSGLQPGSAKTFSQRLSERGIKQDRRKDARGFAGIGLLPKTWHRDDAYTGDDGCDGCSDIGRKAREAPLNNP